MKKQLKTTKPKDRKGRRHINWGRFLFAGFLSATMLAANTMPAFAATTVWEKANEIMKDVYTQILTISTIAAVVTAAKIDPCIAHGKGQIRCKLVLQYVVLI